MHSSQHHRRVPLGLEIHRTILPHDHTAEDANSPETTNLFCAQIMHRVVPAHLFDCTVMLDVEPEAIADQLGISTEAVNAHVVAKSDDVGHVEERDDVHCENTSEESQQKERDSLEHHSRFRELFENRSIPDETVRAFADNLIVRLQGLESGNATRWGVESAKRRRVALPSEESTSQENASLTSAASVKSADSVENESESEQSCGFLANGSHEDLDILCDGFALVKAGKGLYRTARAGYGLSDACHTGNNGNHLYFEVYVVEDCGKDGMCIGVATKGLQLNKLVGSDKASIGLHSTGKLVYSGGIFEEYGEPFKAGDRVGCLVKRHENELPPNSLINSFPSSSSASCVNLNPDTMRSDDCVELVFFINGRRQPIVLKAIKPSKGHEELYPAISLYQKESKAVLCCCPNDWKYAPPTVLRSHSKESKRSCDFSDTTASLCSV